MYPHGRSLVERLKGKPFALLGINSDDTRDEARQAIDKHQLAWRSWWDGGTTGGPIQTAYDIAHWPTIFVLDPRGVIRHIDVRGEELDKAVDALLAEVEGGKP
jgi:hypothetical protein